jgi:hypothetical protein
MSNDSEGKSVPIPTEYPNPIVIFPFAELLVEIETLDAKISKSESLFILVTAIP